MGRRKSERPRFVVEVLRRLLPDPVCEESVEDGLLLKGGDPGLVAVRISDRSLGVSVDAARWDGPHTLVPDHRPLCVLA